MIADRIRELRQDRRSRAVGVQLFGAQYDALEGDTLQLGHLLRGQARVARRGDQMEREATAHAARAPSALRQVGLRSKVLDEGLEPPRRVVPILLHARRVDHERDVVDRDRGLGDIGRHNHLREARGWRRKDLHLILRREG